MADTTESRTSGFTTPQDAAAAAQAAVQKQKDSSAFEFVSVIFEDPDTGKFSFTTPKKGKKGEFRISVNIPKGSLRGIFHNHPPTNNELDEDLQRFFSPDDMSIASQLNVPSFISVGNELLKWDPSDPGKLSVERIRGRRVKFGEGTPVDTETVIPTRSTNDILVNGTD